MYKNNKISAIIPARSGSIRLPNKNLKKFLNLPLIEWTIQQAILSKYINNIYLTTDDKNIQRIINEKYDGFEIFLINRPKKLSKSKTKIYEVIKHVLNKYPLTNFILLQPTSPLRKISNIDNSVQMFFNHKLDSVISICETDYPLSFCNYLNKKMEMVNFIGKPERSQDYKKSYRLNGAIYITNTKKYLNHKSFFMKNSKAYIMNKLDSIDIDTIDDFEYAEYLMRKRLDNDRKKYIC